MSDFIGFLLETFFHPLPLKDRIAIVLSILWCLTVYILAAFIVGESSTYMFAVFWLKYSSPVLIYWPVRLFYVRKKLLSSDYSHSNPNNQHQPDILSSDYSHSSPNTQHQPDIKPIMSLPATKFWLSTSVRRNRLSFIFTVLILFLVGTLADWLITGVVFLISSLGHELSPGFIFWGFNVPIAIPFFVCAHFHAAQRLRDLGVSGLFVFVFMGAWILAFFFSFFAPIFALFFLASFIALCVRPGTKGPNKYGDDPLQETPAAPPPTTP